MKKHSPLRRLLGAALALALAVSLLAVPALADTGGDWEYEVTNGKATITAYTGSDVNLTIPSALGGYPVTGLGSRLFSSRTDLRSVTIPDSVTSIGTWAFSKCSGLKTVTFGSGVTSIGNYAFDGCSSLTGVTIPSGVKTIGECTFANCSGLAAVTLPGGLTKIGSDAFYKCSDLAGITIPDSVTSLDKQAFYSCSGLKTVTFGSGLTSIGEEAFYGCGSLTGAVIPEGVTSLGGRAFFQCSSLQTVSLPNSLTAIPNHAFYGCSELTGVTIPNGAASVGRSAFCGCAALSAVVLPAGLTSVEEFAFSDCGGLTDVWYAGTQTQWNQIGIADNNGGLTNAALHIGLPALSIRYESKTVREGESFRFSAAGGSGIYAWRTGNSSVAAVDSTGLVTGVSPGNTYLYCRDSYGSEVRCLLKITSNPLSIRYTSKTIKVSEQFQFTATGGSEGYTWRTGNGAVAAVGGSGLVTGKTVGNTYLYCTDSSGSQVRCLLKIVPGPLSIRYTEKVVIVSPNLGYGFHATGGTGVYTWRTEDPGVASVRFTSENSQLATVTGISAGNTWLYCTDSAGTEVKCLLKSVYYVYILAYDGMRMDQGSTAVGAPLQFTGWGGSGVYTWRVGNTEIAAVDSTGKVTGVSVGNTYLYCRDSYGIEGRCLLKIVAEPLTIHYTEKTIKVGESFRFTAEAGTGSGYYWTVGNSSIAAVDKGLVTGKSAGNTWLYCRDSYGSRVKCLLRIIEGD